MKNKNDYIFETVDSLGNPVYLNRSTWEGKITKFHPEMAGEEKKVKKTIENPDNIYKDKEYNSTFSYYRKHNSIRLSDTYIKVAVEHSTGGRVKTAYTVDEIGNEGEQIYPSKEITND